MANFSDGVPVYDLIDQPYRGDTFLLTLTTGYPTPDPDNPGQYLKDVNGNFIIDQDNLPDYTGFAMRFQVRPDPNAKKVYADVSTENGDIYFVANTIYVTIPAEIMETLPPIVSYYDLETINPNGFVKTYLRGKFSVTADTTRA
jgi:hypothetical protein